MSLPLKLPIDNPLTLRKLPGESGLEGPLFTVKAFAPLPALVPSSSMTGAKVVGLKPDCVVASIVTPLVMAGNAPLPLLVLSGFAPTFIL